ncbi:MAG TPA: AbrB/MazE/SpoVT family DNA-binding domain-containing protein [Candidatus Saccharimonadales bacterium]|jgi:antitoxin component of MazEF toxin-antitoxin module
MTTSTQTTIKIGDSLGVTLPAKELKRLGVKVGDKLRVSFELEVPAQDDVLKDYAKFKKQYGETLENLATR